MTTLAGDKKAKPDKAPVNREKGKVTSLTPTIARQIRQGIEQPLVTLGIAISVRDKYCGQVIVAGAPDVANAWVDLARTNMTVRRTLQSWATASTWAAVFSSTAAILIPIAAHHGVIPSDAAQQILLNTTPDGDGAMGEPPIEP